MKNICVLIMVCLATLAMAQTKPEPNPKDMAYFCPLCNADCDKLVLDKPGNCPHCNMPLVHQTFADRKMEMSQKPLTVCFYLQNGVEVLDFAGPMEVFSYAGFNVFTVSKTKDPIVSQGILKIIPDYTLKDAPPADILATFGGGAAQGFDDEVIAWIKSREKTTSYFFSVCTEAFAFGKAGLLDNKTATTFHLAIDNLQKSFPKTEVMSGVRFVDNGNVITTAGISAGIDGALHLVAKLRSEAAAKAAAEYMEYDKWVPKEGLILSNAKK